MPYLEEFLKSRWWDLFAEAAGSASDLGDDFSEEQKRYLVSLIGEGIEEGFASYSPDASDLRLIDIWLEQLQPGPTAIDSPTGETQSGFPEQEKEAE